MTEYSAAGLDWFPTWLVAASRKYWPATDVLHRSSEFAWLRGLWWQDWERMLDGMIQQVIHSIQGQTSVWTQDVLPSICGAVDLCTPTIGR
jgi:hypothetical protein